MEDKPLVLLMKSIQIGIALIAVGGWIVTFVFMIRAFFKQPQIS
jgi:hypothetical protein